MMLYDKTIDSSLVTNLTFNEKSDILAQSSVISKNEVAVNSSLMSKTKGP